ncbi:hypothetical protein I302_107117 [Kwoniella bestiolae CBS 10118]|uniref:Pre-rRNA-processing protein TSR4 n=1 Tax=Kwoniella bestiolae CBS 10118 TaxID=1296100 RepID=A0A1B9FZG1_9TREE|nr:pre-rRNA-processing protein TSR4 [Kwoniella bestiolae CBS 10118]OCF24158.1 pre-rRNA-processing protein TSR4 [Kwoniella bestiolae CBS 10118]
MSPSSPAGSSSSSLSEGYTNVLLALPDGTIPPDHADLRSHTVSLIGGYPTFPPLLNTSQIPKEVKCKICNKPIPLLAQVYCPLENGENDRTLYVFACSRAGCQKKDGSIRAFRASIRNDEYVKDVEEKRKAAEAEAEKAREEARKNPFTLSSNAQPNGSALFGSAQPLFGAAPSNPFAAPSSDPTPKTSTDSATEDLSKLYISSSSSSTTLAPPIPAYQPAQYLTTIDEYLPPPEEVEYESSDDEDNADEELKGVMLDDNLERLLNQKVDEVFQAFVRRLEGSDGGLKQVLRYDFGGIPLPYSSVSPITRKLFPGCEKPLTKNQELDMNGLYKLDEKVIKRCERCGGQRTFELQLTPYLLSILKPHTISTTGEVSTKEQSKGKMTEEERKKELNELAKKINEGGAVDDEMEWGNIMVFGCEGDCVGLNEEVVAVEWEMSL